MNTRRVKFILNMAKNVKKLTLANKLVKRGDIIQPTEIISRQSRTDNLRDIEDLVGASSNAAGSSNSIYFSPVQARKRRLLNGEIPKKTNIELEALTPTRVPPKKNKKDEQIDKIKQEFEPQIKQEFIKQENQEGLVNIKKEPDPTLEPSLYIEVESPQPLWYYHLESIRVMRNSKTAPVDTMGCHRCADSKADAKTQRFQNLVALMLSSQTKDQTTYEAMNRLKDQNLTPLKVKEMPITELENLLHPVSFYKELIALPGVGPKMAHICMAVAWNKVTGIGVDVHVHRISNRLGWLPKPTKEPEQTRIALEKWLPHSLWAEVNHLFVGFGQTICTPIVDAPEGNIELFGMQYAMACVVAIVRNIETSSTKITYTLEDHSGRIDAHYWLEEGDALKAPEVMLNNYVKVYGTTRSQAALNARYRAEDYQNKGGSSAVAPSGSGSISDFTASQSSAIVSGLDPKQQAVFQAIKSNVSEEGISRKELKAKFSHISDSELTNIVDFMISEGHIYSSIDADHFICTM
ncbi:hypothetical protein M5D96_003496 [Drosophila gunungcola]|uniref:HhH-GPD domain-containing protein n=1 Tax=Drosophila gunungcola TaxID=103775 RepID=A0A9P9YT54_9MUSC|nr:hypothetical protein M5D96_003496 [Drosophila gunungcola]